MTPRAGLGALLQALVFGLVAQELASRDGLAAGLAGLGALSQLGAALAAFTGRAPLAQRLCALTLGCVAGLVGLFGHAGLHVMRRFGEDAATTGQAALGVTVLALPWLVAFPLWAVLQGRGKAAALLVLGGLLLPPALGRALDQPAAEYAAQPALADAAAAAWSTWQGQPKALPAGEAGPAVVLLTPMRNGVAGATVRGDGDDLQAALADGLAHLAPPRGPDDALLIDLARQRWTDADLPVGRGGALLAEGGLAPAVAWRPGKTTARSPWPMWRLPRIKMPPQGQPTTFDSALATGEGAVLLGAGWAAPRALDADAVLAAAVAGAQMLIANQGADGRYAYTVKGPSGDFDTGYNLPRHAGATWFLARVAARTGDPAIAAAADRGLAWMAEQTTTLPDGRAFVADGRRRDGVAWVGTTALAVLAATTRGSPLAGPWAAYVASSVDEDGAVRGEAPRATGLAAPQARNPYGQGQATLALGAALQAGDARMADPAARAAAFIDGAYSPLGANRLVILDEHWACLAALRLKAATGTPAGLDLCRAYVHHERFTTPAVAGGFRTAAGPAGGLAEAVVSLAFLEPDGPWTAMALAHGAQFLDAAYQAADAPFLGQPRRLIGGFRDGPIDLDVRMDAVQHIGCALLGIEALLRGDTPPGALP